MAEPLIPRPASDAGGHLPGPLGLRLDEEFLPLTALGGAAEALDAIIPFGTWRQTNGALFLRYAPGTVLLSGPCPDGPYIAVDIGHGLTRLRLRGVEALHFLDQYTCADLHAIQVRRDRAARTRLNHYDCALWWPTTRDINILVDRSSAQSFVDHLRALSLRHDPAYPTQMLRPVAPNAPDRRG